MDQEIKSRLVEAKGCNGCPMWLKHCQAECCKIAYINLSPIYLKEKGKYLNVHKGLLKDDIWYWKLRGVRYVHGVLMFEKKYCKPLGNRILYVRKCDKLTEDNLCGGHPFDKPKICQKLNEETAIAGDNSFEVTPNCLFKYKKMIREVESNG